jgi:hypothetical protein
MIKAALQLYTRKACSPAECRSGRPRETGKLEDIADLRLMPLLVECDSMQQLQYIVDAHQRMLVNHCVIVERWVLCK